MRTWPARSASLIADTAAAARAAGSPAGVAATLDGGGVTTGEAGPVAAAGGRGASSPQAPEIRSRGTASATPANRRVLVTPDIESAAATARTPGVDRSTSR